MASNTGKNIKISLFGESHGNAIGVTIDGLKSGIKLNLEYIKDELNKRKSIVFVAKNVKLNQNLIKNIENSDSKTIRCVKRCDELFICNSVCSNEVIF